MRSGMLVLLCLLFALPAAHDVAAGMATEAGGAGQIREAPQNPPPDARFKADILVIVAHPDDETDSSGLPQ